MTIEWQEWNDETVKKVHGAYLSQVLLEIIESIGKVDDLLNDRKSSLLIQSIVRH